MYNNLLPEVRKQTNRNRGSTSLVHSRDCNQGNRVTREVSWCVDHTKNLNQFLFATTSSPLSRKLPSKHLLNNSQYGDCRLLQETPVYPVSTPKTVRTKISKKKKPHLYNSAPSSSIKVWFESSLPGPLNWMGPVS